MLTLSLINFIYVTVDMSLFVYYFHNFLTFSPSPTFRLIWGYIDWTSFVLQLLLFAWATIERHILIFHDHLVSTRRKRLFVHYLPSMLITIYIVVYYLVVFFAVQCDNHFDSIGIPSMFPCALQGGALSIYDTMAHFFSSTLIIVGSSVVLLIRALWQGHRMHRQVTWRRHRKMIVQVICISMAYVIFLFPYEVTVLLVLCGVSSNVLTEYEIYAVFSSNYTLLLFPMICLGSVGEFRPKLKKILWCGERRRRAVGPAMLVKWRKAPMPVVNG